MTFNSIEYLFFLPIVFLLYWFVFKGLRQQNLLLIIVNYCFMVNQEMLHECDSISKEMEKIFSNVTYINAFNDRSFVPDDFRNSNHLSRKGAKKLSLELNEELSRL